MSSHNFGQKRAFLRLILIFEISHTHTHTHKILAHHPLVSESKDRTSGADPGFFLGGVHSSLALLQHQ